MRRGTLARDAMGATAIEYAILAGLIGLGLVGSLVATRGSLSLTYSTVAEATVSDAGSASGAQPVARVTPAGQLVPLANKTLATQRYYVDSVGRPEGSYRWTYTDGSMVTLTVSRSASQYYSVKVQDVDNPNTVYFGTDRNGNVQAFQQSSYDANGKLAQTIVSQIGQFSNNQPTAYYIRTYYPSGTEKSQTLYTPDSNYTALYADYFSNFTFYKDQMGSMQ